MFFNKKYLTTAGKNLLDQAVAGSTITWGTCATSSLSYVNDDTARALTDIAVNGKYTSLGTVTTVAHGKIDPNNVNSNLIIKASLKNSGTTVESGEARTFGVWAKSGENGTETLVIVAFWHLDEGSPETVPEYSQSSPFEATVDLYIKTSDNVISTIDSTSTWATPLSDFIAFQQDVDNKLATLEADIDSLGDNSNLATEINTINGKLSTLESSVNNLSTDIEENSASIGDLNTFKTVAAQNISTLNGFMTRATQDINNLNALKDKVVTTDDEQTIDGAKHFNSSITVNSTATLNSVKCLNDLDVNGNIEANDVTINSLTCNKLNINEPFEEDFRKKIAGSLAGASSSISIPAVGCMRLVAISEKEGDAIPDPYIKAGTVLSGYTAYIATFSNGVFETFKNNGTMSYHGTWQLITELSDIPDTEYFSYALAVRVL